jgi:Domain of unknown function (DUF4115)
VVQPVVQPAAQPTATLTAIEDPLPYREPSGGGGNWLYWIGGGVIAGLAGLFLVNQLSHLPAAPPTQEAVVPVKPAQSDSPKPSPSASASPSPAASPAATGPVSVSINVTEDSWIEIEADGKTLEASTLPKGTQKSWSAAKSLNIFTGNARGVAVSYNQSPPKPMGTSANPAEMRFPDKPAN